MNPICTLPILFRKFVEQEEERDELLDQLLGKDGNEEEFYQAQVKFYSIEAIFTDPENGTNTVIMAGGAEYFCPLKIDQVELIISEGKS